MAPKNKSETVILVVDDNEEVLNALRRMLVAEEYSVVCASGPTAAQELLTNNPPDLILSDVLMPDEDGFSFYERIRKETTLNNIPFILLTAHDSDESRLRAARSGCDDYIIKPFEPDTLLALVEGNLHRARQREEFSAQRMQALHRRIIHTLSHEFRTPLVSIQAGAELLIDKENNEGTEDPTSKLILEAILTGGRRLQRLVEDFMLLQQLDLNQNSSLNKSSNSATALSRAVETTVESFVSQRRINMKHPLVRFSVVGDGEIEEVQVLGDYLSDILLRFLENAYKFGGTGQPIDVKVVLSQPRAEIIIRDYGPGFLEDPEAGRVFEPFLQIKRDIYEQQGCGVGLTIAQFLARMSGYELHFSAPEEGTGVVVHIIVPVAQTQPVEEGVQHVVV